MANNRDSKTSQGSSIRFIFLCTKLLRNSIALAEQSLPSTESTMAKLSQTSKHNKNTSHIQEKFNSHSNQSDDSQVVDYAWLKEAKIGNSSNETLKRNQLRTSRHATMTVSYGPVILMRMKTTYALKVSLKIHYCSYAYHFEPMSNVMSSASIACVWNNVRAVCLIY